MTNRTNRKDRTAAGTRFVLLTVAALLMSGCMRSRQLENLCNELIDQYTGAHISKEISLTLGPFSLGMAKFAAGFREDTRNARKYLSGVSKVQLAIYNVDSGFRRTRLSRLDRFHRMLEEDGWEIVVKSSEKKEETAWILFREDDGLIKDLHITSVDDHELIMVRVTGHLNEIFDKATKEYGSILGKVRSDTGGRRRTRTSGGGE